MGKRTVEIDMLPSSSTFAEGRALGWDYAG